MIALIFTYIFAVVNSQYRVPSWNMDPLNPLDWPYGWQNGQPYPYKSSTYTRLFFSGPDNGTYNMAPMIHYLKGYYCIIVLLYSMILSNLIYNLISLK
jgi:hypothetical protein